MGELNSKIIRLSVILYLNQRYRPMDARVRGCIKQSSWLQAGYAVSTRSWYTLFSGYMSRGKTYKNVSTRCDHLLRWHLNPKAWTTPTLQGWGFTVSTVPSK